MDVSSTGSRARNFNKEYEAECDEKYDGWDVMRFATEYDICIMFARSSSEHIRWMFRKSHNKRSGGSKSGKGKKKKGTKKNKHHKT